MASLNVTGLDKVMQFMYKYTLKQNVDAMAKKAVESCRGKIVSATKASISMSERGAHSTGSVAASIDATQTRINAYGAYLVARPTGRDSKGVRNGEKAAYLEYGTPTLPARPWRNRVVVAAREPCMKIMEQVVAKELDAK